jgi:uncharacterized protein (DUF1778 family)
MASRRRRGRNRFRRHKPVLPDPQPRARKGKQADGRSPVPQPDILRPRKSSSLMIRLDDESKACLRQAAELRRISVSDYVRVVTVAQARREVRAAREQTLALSAEEQLAFWNALNRAPKLTDAQRELGSLMRRKS